MIPFVANEATFAAGAGAEYRLIGFREAGRLVACVCAHLSDDTAEFLQVYRRHGYRRTHTSEAGAYRLVHLAQGLLRRPGAFSSRRGCS